MFLYALYYYDRPLLEAWLNHYVRFDCIEEIIIQNQNWSVEDTTYLLETVANYVDKHHKKIVVLPSNFKRFENQNKRSQFLIYGQSVIRNRVTQFLQNETFIASSIDEVIYEKNYEYTEEQLQKFENLAGDRAKKGLSTIGFMPLHCAWPDVICPCNGIPIKRLKRPTWRHRLFRFALPFQRRKSLIHDTTYEVFVERHGKKRWVDATPSSSLSSRKSVEDYQNGFVLDLKLIHYHTLVHPEFDSARYRIPSLSSIQNLKEHPKFYIEKLDSSSVLKPPKKSGSKPIKAFKNKQKKFKPLQAETIKPEQVETPNLEYRGQHVKHLKQGRKRPPREYSKQTFPKPSVTPPKQRSKKQLKQWRKKATSDAK